MKHWVGVFFIYLFAVTSGVTQFSFHSCKVDGLHVLQHDCNAEKESKTEVKDCCSKKHQMPSKNSIQCEQSDLKSDCCIVNYYFGFAPIPQKISKFQLCDFKQYYSLIFQGQIPNLNNIGLQNNDLEKIPPKPKISETSRKIELQSCLQVWVI